MVRRALAHQAGVQRTRTAMSPEECRAMTPAVMTKPEEIAEVLKTGATPNHGRVGSSMADVVTNTAMLPQSDRDAIAVYIKSLPPRDTPQP